MLKYRNYRIFEANGKFTVGNESCNEFDDCTLENIETGDELAACNWCMNHGNKVSFVGLRGETEGKVVSYERYLEHLMRYKTEPEDFTDEEFIVPCVEFKSVNKAKEFIDWLEDKEK